MVIGLVWNVHGSKQEVRGELLEETGSVKISTAGIEISTNIENSFRMFFLQFINAEDHQRQGIHKLPLFACSWKIDTNVDTKRAVRRREDYWQEC